MPLTRSISGSGTLLAGEEETSVRYKLTTTVGISVERRGGHLTGEAVAFMNAIQIGESIPRLADRSEISIVINRANSSGTSIHVNARIDDHRK